MRQVMPMRPGHIVYTIEEAASAAQSVTVAFDAGDPVSEVFDSCTMSRKYVINNPMSYNCSTTRQNSVIIYRTPSILLIVGVLPPVLGQVTNQQ